MTIEEFAAAVQTAVAMASGLPGTQVVWENPNVPRPARPFISLTIEDDGEIEPLGEESVIDNPNPDPPTGGNAFPYTFPFVFLASFPSDNPILVQATDRPEISIRLTAYTNAPKSSAISPAFTLLKAVRRALGGDAMTEQLDPITVLERGNVQNITVMLETGYEGRAVLDVKFGSIETQSDDANTIETVEVEVTVNDEEGNPIVDQTITLPNE